MNSKAFYSSIVCVSGLMLASNLFAQTPRVEFPAPSPRGTVQQRVGLTDIEVVYSRPGVKDRKIFGDLVPYGEVWRTGANASTKISFSKNVKLNGNEVPAGRYGLYAIPGENEWTIIVHKNADLNGTTGYNQENDLVRFKVNPVKLAEPVETFTIDINDIRDGSATLNLIWERIRVPVKIEVSALRELPSQIEAAMASSAERKPYYQAAQFYYDNGLDLRKASQWVDAAVAENELFYMVHLKAKIRAKLGDKEGAIAAAKRSSELASKANNSDYVRLNSDLIAGLR